VKIAGKWPKILDPSTKKIILDPSTFDLE